MKAKLYITPETFKYNHNTSTENVMERIASLTELINFVIPRQEDVFYLNWTGLYETELFEGLTIDDIITDSVSSIFHDIQTFVLSILAQCEQIQDTKESIESIVNNQLDCAIIVFNEYEGNVNKENQIIANIDEWYKYHRSYLYLHPYENCEDYLCEVKKYFENIVIHDSVKAGLKTVYSTHLRRITQSLILLNDNLLDNFQKSKYDDFIEFLREFESKYSNIIDGASFLNSYDNDSKKKQFKVVFFIKGEYKEYICNPHIKLNSNDDGVPHQYCRIYFAPVKKIDTCILIGFICKHKNSRSGKRKH